jgi:antitoxin VapB
MALNIKNAEAERLARALAQATGESLTEAVTVALRERLEAARRVRERAGVYAAVKELQAFVAELPDRDTRSADEIVGYDEFGLPSGRGG